MSAFALELIIIGIGFVGIGMIAAGVHLTIEKPPAWLDELVVKVLFAGFLAMLAGFVMNYWGSPK